MYASDGPHCIYALLLPRDLVYRTSVGGVVGRLSFEDHEGVAIAGRAGSKAPGTLGFRNDSLPSPLVLLLARVHPSWCWLLTNTESGLAATQALQPLTMLVPSFPRACALSPSHSPSFGTLTEIHRHPSGPLTHPDIHRNPRSLNSTSIHALQGPLFPRGRFGGYSRTWSACFRPGDHGLLQRQLRVH